MTSGAVVRAQYEEQLGWAAEEGVDFVIAETNDFLGEALIGLEVCQELGLPAMVTFASVQDATTYDGYGYVEACRDPGRPGRGGRRAELLARAGDDAAAARRDPLGGRRPGRGAAGALPDHSGDAGVRGADRDDGLHAFPIALEPFQCTRFEMADFAVRARDIGVDYIGICCGGGPHHVRAMAEALGRQTPASRYSPAIELHPVLGTPRAHRDHGRLDRRGGLAIALVVLAGGRRAGAGVMRVAPHLQGQVGPHGGRRVRRARRPRRPPPRRASRCQPYGRCYPAPSGPIVPPPPYTPVEGAPVGNARS